MPASMADDAMGLVLAGGSSSRFGRDKALEPVGGIPMVRLVYQALAAVIRDVRVGLPEAGMRNPIPGAPVVLDDPPGAGPRSSLRAALREAGRRWVFAAACDMPGLTPGAVRAILEERSDSVDVVVPVDPTGRIHPLAAAWSPRSLPLLEYAGPGRTRSLTAVVDDLRSVRVPLDPDVLLNVNRPEDLDARGTA